MTDMATEFEKATNYELKDEDIERARMLLGVDTASRHREHISVATPDALRNWALGMGDDNPLYTAEEYGPKTRWGTQIGPGIMLGSLNSPLKGDPLPDELKKATKSLFRGIHVFVSGSDWTWYQPLRPGDRVYSFSGEETIEEKKSDFAGRSVIQVSRNVKFNQYGEVLGVYRILRVLTERKKSRERARNMEIEPASYTDEDIERIDEIYASEQRRGAEPRYWEDVEVGDEMPPMVKGPLTVTEVIAFHAGGYGFVPYGLRSSRLGYQNRKRIAPFYIKNEQGVPDVAQRLHWDSAWAQAIGNPMAYDYGVMRECWFYHYVSDWMGDDAFIVRQHDSLRKFNYMGDTQFLSGEVVDKRQDGDMFVVDLDMKMTNQRDVETSFGQATVSLPSRAAGAAALPPVPTDLQRRTEEMYARHRELVHGSD